MNGNSTNHHIIKFILIFYFNYKLQIEKYDFILIRNKVREEKLSKGKKETKSVVKILKL